MASARIARDEHVPFATENKNGKQLKVISLIQQHLFESENLAKTNKTYFVSVCEKVKLRENNLFKISACASLKIRSS